MKRFFRHTAFLLLIALAALGLSSCEKGQREKRERPDKLEIVSLDKVSGNILDGLKATMTIKNNTTYNLTIPAAEAFLQYNGRKIGRLAIDGEIVLPRRCATQVEIPIRVTVSNVMSALSAFKLLSQGEYKGFTVNYNATIKTRTLKIELKDENVTLEEMAKDFNKAAKNDKK